MPHLSYTKDYQGVADVFLRDPGLYGPLLQFIEGVMTRDSALTKAQREMIASHVSNLNGCGFCLGAHRWTLAAMDIDPAIIDGVEAGAETAPVGEEFRAVLRFAEKLTTRPREVGEADIGALTAAGWSEQAVEDAINVISLFAYMNRLVDALGIEGNENYFKQVGATLATQGYAPLIKSALKKAS